MVVEAWASWEGGVALIANLRPGQEAPDLIVQVARMLRTPRGEAPAAYVRWQPAGSRAFEAVLSPDLEVARWSQDLSGSAHVPVQVGSLEIVDVDQDVVARLEFGWHRLEIRFTGQGPHEIFDRPYEGAHIRMAGVEASVVGVAVRLDGEPLPLARVHVASWMPAGVIARC